ncbi:hypothetical protein BC828DRAFT_388669 [Blastocladiella britannica]|nr:hypothetical protein BC828DRAFT_388669 [Blastocladiella britannica]
MTVDPLQPLEIAYAPMHCPLRPRSARSPCHQRISRATRRQLLGGSQRRATSHTQRGRNLTVGRSCAIPTSNGPPSFRPRSCSDQSASRIFAAGNPNCAWMSHSHSKTLIFAFQNAQWTMHGFQSISMASQRSQRHLRTSSCPCWTHCLQRTRSHWSWIP